MVTISYITDNHYGQFIWLCRKCYSLEINNKIFKIILLPVWLIHTQKDFFLDEKFYFTVIFISALFHLSFQIVFLECFRTKVSSFCQQVHFENFCSLSALRFIYAHSSSCIYSHGSSRSRVIRSRVLDGGQWAMSGGVSVGHSAVLLPVSSGWKPWMLRNTPTRRPACSTGGSGPEQCCGRPCCRRQEAG